METNRANVVYEVLNPWADVDPIPLRGLTDRVTDLAGKKVGLFRNSKRVAPLCLNVVRNKFKERFPTLEFSPFVLMPNAGVLETEDKARFEEWVKEVDAVIFAYGD